MPQAAKSYRQAITLAAVLEDRSPKPKYLELAALACNNLAAVLMQSQPAESEKLLLQAQKLLKDKLVAANPDVPQYGKELGRAYLGLAVLWKGKGNKSADALTEAEKIFIGLNKDFQGVVDYQDLLAMTYQEMALDLQERKQFDKAEANRQQAVKLLEGLAVKAKDVPRFRRELAHLYHDQAVYQARQDDATAAAKLLDKALTLQKQLATQHPATAEYHVDQALTYYTLGMVALQAKDGAGAEKRLLQSLAELDKAGKPAPALAKKWREIAINDHTYLASLVLQTKGIAPFKHHCTQLIEVLELEAKDFAGVPAVHFRLAQTHQLLADQLKKHQQEGEAEIHYRQAVEGARQALQLSPADPAARELLAQSALGWCECLLAAKDHSGVAKAAAATATDFPARADMQFRLAEVLGHGLNLVKVDAKLSTKQQADLTKQYGDQVMAMLELAVKRGHTQTQLLKTGLAFEGVRERADFQKLIKQLDGK